MNDIELYNEIGKWLNVFHRHRYYRLGLINDFKNDLWIRLRDKTGFINIQYIKKCCYYYPLEAIRTLYYKKDRNYYSREIILLTEDGDYVEFPSDLIVDYELPKPIVKKRTTRYLPDFMLEDIRKARQEGFSYDKIAKKFSISSSAAYNAVNKKRFERRNVKVTFVNGEEKSFESTQKCATELGVSYQSVYYFLKQEHTGRFMNRKLSHIKLIEYADN